MTLERALEEKKSKTFEFIDQRNSGFQLKDTIGTPNPICLRSSKLNLITMTSELCLGKGKGYAKIQYIPNAPVIHIEDMWVDSNGMLHSKAEKKQSGWEEQKGLKSLGYDIVEELKKAKDLKIGFEFGLLSLDKYGDDPTLLTYINNHHCNISRPNAEHDTKQHTGLFKFRCVQMDKKAEFALETMDSELSAIDYVNSLRSKDGKGFIYTAGDKAKIDATLRILDITPGCQPEEYSRKHLLIKQYSDSSPVQFMEVITETLNQYHLEIAKAVACKVLEFDQKVNNVSLLSENKDKKIDRKVIMTFISKNSEDQTEELSIHFVNDSGIVAYKEMLMLTGMATRKN